MEGKNKQVITNKKQFERLVDIMKENTDIARAYTKSGKDFKIELKKRWEKITEDLNCLGPPTRNANGWIKVWTDFKYKIKKKKMQNKTEIKATGGGRNKLHHFTPLEEDVIDLLNIDCAVNPPGREFGVILDSDVPIIPRQINVVLDENTPPQENLSNVRIEEIQTPLIRDDQPAMPPPPRQRNMKTKRLQLLEKQCEAQEKLFIEVKNAVREIKIVSNRNLECNQKLVEMKAEKLQLYRNFLKDKAKYQNDKLKLKVQFLKLKKQQLYLQESDARSSP